MAIPSGAMMPMTTSTTGGGGGGATGGAGGTISTIPIVGSLHYNTATSTMSTYTGNSWIPVAGLQSGQIQANTISSVTLAPSYTQYAYVRKDDGSCVSLDIKGQEYHYEGRPLVDVLQEYKEVHDMAQLYSEVQEALDYLRTVVKMRRE